MNEQVDTSVLLWYVGIIAFGFLPLVLMAIGIGLGVRDVVKRRLHRSTVIVAGLWLLLIVLRTVLFSEMR